MHFWPFGAYSTYRVTVRTTRDRPSLRPDNEAVVVNITDVDPVEKPEEVYWVDPIHKDPGAAR